MRIKTLLLLSLLAGSSSAEPIKLNIVGMMQCMPAWTPIGNGDVYDRHGCKTNEGILSLKKYFDKYKQSDAYEITNVHYDSIQNVFHIYYGTVWQ